MTQSFSAKLPRTAFSYSTQPFPRRLSRKLPWWAGAIFYVGITILARLISGSPKKAKETYALEPHQAPWAPPGWAFGPAWAIVNLFLVRILLKMVNEKYKDRNTRQLIWLQAFQWWIFITFGYVYFRRHNLILCAIWTQCSALVAAVSFVKARRKGRVAATHYVPLLAWAWYASTVAWYQALQNDDAAQLLLEDNPKND